MEHFGFTQQEFQYCTQDMHPELKKTVDLDIEAKAEQLKTRAMATYCMTDEGQKEIEQLHADLTKAVKRVLLHRQAVVTSQKINGEAGQSILEKCGDKANFFVFELFIKNRFMPMESAREADALLMEANEKILEIEPKRLAETLCQNPLWFHEMLAQFERIDNLYREAMPKNEFPPDDFIVEMERLVNKTSWTPETSAILALKSVLHDCQNQ